jgi:hypothetical protein
MEESRRQTLVLIAVVAVMLVIMTVAFMAGRGTISGVTRQGPAPVLTTENPRDKQIIIERQGEMALPEVTGSAAEPLSSNEIERHAQEVARSIDESREIIRKAQQATSIEQAVSILYDRVVALRTLEAASEIYTAISATYLRAIPPRYDEALQAAKEAERLATNVDDRVRALLAQFQVLGPRGSMDELVPRAEDVLARVQEVSPASAALGVQVGRHHEERGDLGKAEQWYKSTADRLALGDLEANPELRELYRLSCLQLARIYRESDRPDEADALARKMMLFLGETPPPAYSPQ